MCAFHQDAMQEIVAAPGTSRIEETFNREVNAVAQKYKDALKGDTPIDIVYEYSIDYYTS